MSEKTEAPTPRRISEAREEGRVALSRELNTAAVMLVGTWLLTGAGKNLITEIQAVMVSAVTLETLPTGDPNLAWFVKIVIDLVLRLTPSMTLFVSGVLLTGVTITVSQTGFLFARKRIGFDFSRLNPLSGIKRLVSLQGVVELFKALLKLVIVTWVVYSFLRARMGDLLGLVQIDFLSALGTWTDMAVSLAIRVGAAYLVLAIADYAYQRWQHSKSMKMTKEEVKEDMKRTEGNPQIKGRIRRQQRQMARMRMMANVPKADVVITNPTHLAVAIKYDAGAMTAPVVLAKGAYLVAERIVEIARDNNIPVVQNIPLARALYRRVRVDQEIDADLYLAVAEILAYVYKMRGRVPVA